MPTYYTLSKKPVTNNHTLYESIYAMFRISKPIETEAIDWWLPGAGEGMERGIRRMIKGYRVSFMGNEENKCSKIVVMAAQFDYNKSHWTVYFKCDM